MKNFIRKIWNWIVALISKVPYDKLLHFIAGLLIAALFGITLHMKVAIVPVIFAGFFKEFFDIFTTNEWDWWDFAATCAGGLFIQLFIILG